MGPFQEASDGASSSSGHPRVMADSTGGGVSAMEQPLSMASASPVVFTSPLELSFIFFACTFKLRTPSKVLGEMEKASKRMIAIG